jgi:formylglycine-generating enzyme required for sulfatase activity
MNRLLVLSVSLVIIFITSSCANKSSSPIASSDLTIDTPTPTYSSTFTNTPTDTIDLLTNTFTQTPTEIVTSTNTPVIPVGTVVTNMSYTSFVSVPGGTFNQRDQYDVSFDHTITGFIMAQSEITSELWYTVYQWAIANGYTFERQGQEGSTGIDGAVPTANKYMPASNMTWRDIIVWCNAYSELTGKTQVYCSDVGFTTPIKNSTNGTFTTTSDSTPGSFDNPYVNWNCNGFRLPTEGEWNYAACYIDGSSWSQRSYLSGATDDYNNEIASRLVAYYDGDPAGSQSHLVGEKNPIAVNIYDMSGNISEFCWDKPETYPVSAMIDYRGSTSNLTARERRGGYYQVDAFTSAVGSRNFGYAYTGYGFTGFRLARSQ